jgi:hypothetical protein
MGAHDLLANGAKVAVVEHHKNQPFDNAGSRLRNALYHIVGTPQNYFDGTYVGCGSATTSCYNTFLPVYNQKIVIPSDFTIQMSATHNGLNYNLHVVVNKVGTCSSNDLRLVCVLTQSNIPYNWGPGLTTVDWINRIMIPSPLGSPVDFCGGTTKTFDLPFTIDGSWPVADLEIVAFLQDFDSKTVYQGTKSPLNAVGLYKPIMTDYKLNVYPNPAKDITTIAFDTEKPQPAVISIIDNIGKCVFFNNISQTNPGINTVSFDCSKLSAGLYIIKLEVGNDILTKKITISN